MKSSMTTSHVVETMLVLLFTAACTSTIRGSRQLYSLKAVKVAVTSNQNSLVKSELSFSAENMPLTQNTVDP